MNCLGSLSSVKFRPSEETAEHLREFSDGTTLHGVRYVGERDRHPVERFFWVLAIFVSATICGLEVWKTFTRYQTVPVILSFAQHPTSLPSILYPAITICPTNTVPRSKFNMDINYEELMENASENSSLPSDETLLTYQAASLVCLYMKNKPAYFVPNKTHVDILKKISPSIKDTILRTIFQVNPVNSSSVFRPIMTSEGICFSYNIEEDQELYSSNLDVATEGKQESNSDTYPRKAWTYDTKRAFALSIMLGTPINETQRPCSSGYYNNVSFKVALHSPQEVVSQIHVLSNFIDLEPSSHTQITVTPSLLTSEPELIKYDPKLRGCLFDGEKKLNFLKHYTESNCAIDCHESQLREKFKCQPFYYPPDKFSNYPLCNTSVEDSEEWIELMKKTFEDDIQAQIRNNEMVAICGCLPSCSELTYKYILNTGTFIPPKPQPDMVYAKLTIYFQEKSFYALHRSEVFGLTDMLSNIGGLLGLFTGFSVITAVEIFYFASLRLACRRRQKQKIEQENELSTFTQ